MNIRFVHSTFLIFEHFPAIQFKIRKLVSSVCLRLGSQISLGLVEVSLGLVRVAITWG